MQAYIYPVVHVESLEQARREVGIITNAGADGVFLINHSQSSAELAEVIKTLKTAGDLGPWTGANFLGLGSPQVFEYAGELGLDGLWTDNAGIWAYPGWDVQAQAELETRRHLAPHTQYFGGVAFKYQPQRVEAEVEAAGAEDYLDVITTSGPGTASAAEISKLSAMAEAVGRDKLAVASGVTPENAHDQFQYVAHVLVASGIARDWHHVDEDRLRALLEVRDAIRQQ